MCMTPSSEDVKLYDEARRAFRSRDIEKLREIYNRILEINASPEIAYIVRRMLDDLEKQIQEEKVKA
ncbi:MAG: hypothetical protein F7C81_04260 [Desulfurococcales archaeon]|nr:hypothetical protein [Desulfurococcales archaeon]MEB3779338.1 hypothetical protein [Desulfurococcales archaeon]